MQKMQNFFLNFSADSLDGGPIEKITPKSAALLSLTL